MKSAPAVLSVLLALSACGGDSVAPDAPPPGSPLGAWTVQWTCIIGCHPSGAVPLQYDDRVEVLSGVDAGGEDVRWFSEGCADCTIVDHGTLAGDCIAVASGEHDGVKHEPYTVCGTADGVEATITWTGYPGWPDPRTWKAQGKPL
jgi:hypothetical protein